MTTLILQAFKEEPGLNAPKINKRQIVRSVDIKFSEIQERPKTLAGYGIKDGVTKNWIDEKIQELQQKITEMKTQNETLQQKIQQLEQEIAMLKNKS